VGVNLHNDYRGFLLASYLVYDTVDHDISYDSLPAGKLVTWNKFVDIVKRAGFGA
jgi:hypothetical protein